MRVVTLNPPFLPHFSRAQRSPAVTKGGTLYYPFWLAYTTGVLEKEGFDVKLIDAPAQTYDIKQTLALVEEFKPKLVVIETSTPSIYNDIKIAESIKDVLDGAFIVLVGTHPSALPEETLKVSAKIDAVARGEYEYTVRDLARALANGGDLESVDGISLRRENKFVHNKPRSLIEDLDSLPFVSEVYKRHLNPRDYYFAAADYPMVMIITGRGCPSKCFFCVYPQTLHSRQYRVRSPENVVREFEYIAENLPQVKEIGIEDDTFTANRRHVREICDLLIEKKLNIKWYANVRADLDSEIMEKMKLAGCRLLIVGFESGNQEILQNMHKGLSITKMREFAKAASKVGLLLHGCIMIGNPGETKETMCESFELAKELKCDSMQFYPLFVYPGTEAYDWAAAKGFLKTTDYSQWVTKNGSHNALLNLPDLSAEEITQFCEKAYKDYHLRPKYILYKMKQAIIHPDEGKRTIRSAMRYFKYLASDYLKERNTVESVN